MLKGDAGFRSGFEDADEEKKEGGVIERRRSGLRLVTPWETPTCEAGRDDTFPKWQNTEHGVVVSGSVGARWAGVCVCVDVCV